MGRAPLSNFLASPVVVEHEGIAVVRDDMFPGGTKARYLWRLFEDADELVYASPAEGGAQTALATVAAILGKKATIFVAKRKNPHERALMAKRLGATIWQVSPGYFAVVQKRARDYCAATGARQAPFGVDMPEAIDAIADAALATGQDPDEVWCASGSGVLCRGLSRAWPDAKVRVVQVGRKLSNAEVSGAEINVAPIPFEKKCKEQPPFPSDPHYDAKAWQICKARRGAGRVLFWNVTGPAVP